MKRKLFAVLLAVVATLSLTVFGVTALAETPTPKNEITAVDYENVANGYGMGLAVKGFTVEGSYWAPLASEYVVLKKADGTVVSATVESCGKQVAVARGQGYTPAVGDTITFKAGFTYGACYLDSDVTWTYNGAAFSASPITLIHVSAVNMDTAWNAVGIQVADSTNTGNMIDVSVAASYIVIKDAEGKVFTPHTYWAMGANIYCFIHNPDSGDGNWIGLPAGSTLEVKAGCPFLNGEVIETGATYVYNGTLWSVKQESQETVVTEIGVESVNYVPTGWGAPTIVVKFILANNSAYGTYMPGDLANLSYVNAWGEEKPLADCTYVNDGHFIARMAESLNPNVNEYTAMVGDKFIIKQGFKLTSATTAEETKKEYVYIVNETTVNGNQLVPYDSAYDVTSFEITNDEADNVVYIDAQKQLTYTANEGALYTPKFTSSNEGVATVDARTGLVTGVSTGSATISAQVGSIVCTYDVEVKPAPVMKSLEINSYEIVTLKGEEAVIPANFSVYKVYDDGSQSTPIPLTGENARFKEPVDTSEVPAVTGKVKATIVVTVDEVEYEFEQYVVIHEVADLEFTEAAVVEWFAFATFVEYPNCTTNVANFTGDTAVTTGELENYFDHIAYYRDGEQINCGTYLLGGGNIALFPDHVDPTAEVTIDNFGTVLYKKGDIIRLSAGLTVYGHTGITDAANGKWSNDNGMLYKDAVLKQDVAFRFNGVGWDLYVPYTDIAVENETIEVSLGTNNATVGAKRVPDNATTGKFVYTVDNEDVLTVSENGRITAKSVGTAIITVTLSDDGENAKVATVTVTVVNKIVRIELDALTVSFGTEEIDKTAIVGYYVYGDGSKEQATDLADATVVGFDPSVAGEQTVVLRVTHEGETFTANLTVNVETKKAGAACGSALGTTGFFGLFALAAAYAISKKRR